MGAFQSLHSCVHVSQITISYPDVTMNDSVYCLYVCLYSIKLEATYRYKLTETTVVEVAVP